MVVMFLYLMKKQNMKLFEHKCFSLKMFFSKNGHKSTKASQSFTFHLRQRCHTAPLLSINVYPSFTFLPSFVHSQICWWNLRYIHSDTFKTDCNDWGQQLFSCGLCMFIVHKPLVIQGKLMGHQHAKQAGNGSVSSVFRSIMICALCCISISNWGIIITDEFLLANHLGQHVWCKEAGG